MYEYRMSPVKSNSNGIHPLEFIMQATDEYIDLGRSYFEVELQLKKANGANIADGDNLFPGQNLIHTMIKQCSITFNGTLISPQSDTYAYRAFFETLLNNDSMDGHTILKLHGFQVNALNMKTPLTGDNLDGGTPHADYIALPQSQKNAVLSMKADQVHYQAGKRRTLFFKPHSEAFHMGKLLVPMVEMVVSFYFNEPKFFLNGLREEGRLTEADIKMTFHACQVKLTPPLRNSLDLKRNQGNYAKYPLVRSDVRTFAIPAGQTDFDQDRIFLGRIPDRMIVGLLHQNSFNGDYAYNPFSFQQFGLLWIKQLINGEEYPYKTTLSLNPDDGNKDLTGYFRFLQATSAWKENKPNLLKPEEWGYNKNCTLYMFDNVASGNADSPLMNIKQEGGVRLQFRLNAALGHVVTVVIFGEFENVMEITK